MLPLLSAALLLSPAAAPGKRPDAVACKQLAKTAAAVLHAVPVGAVVPGEWGNKPPREGWGAGVVPLGDRYQITHTDLKTGKMAKIVAGGQWAFQSPPMGIDRVKHHAVGISAVTADDDRLYVLIVRAEETVMVLGQESKAKFEKVDQQLLVFRIDTGKLEQELPLPAKTERLGNLYADHVEDQGVLLVTKTGVRIGTEKAPHATFTRKGGTLEADAK